MKKDNGKSSSSGGISVELGIEIKLQRGGKLIIKHNFGSIEMVLGILTRARDTLLAQAVMLKYKNDLIKGGSLLGIDGNPLISGKDEV